MFNSKFNFFVNKTLKYVEDSTTLKEQISYFLGFWFLLPTCTLSYALLLSSLYFSITIISAFFRHELNISSAGWKEKCTLKKLMIVVGGIIAEEFGYEIENLFDDLRDIVQQKAPCVVELYDLIVAPALSDAAVNQFDFEEEKRSNLETEAELVKNALDRRIDELRKARAREVVLSEQLEDLRKDAADQLSLALTIYDLEVLLAESQDMEKEARALNDSLFEQLYISQTDYKQLQYSLIDVFNTKHALVEHVGQLEYEVMNCRNMVYQLEQEKFYLIEQVDMREREEAELAEDYEFLISEMNETVQGLQIEKNELFAKLSIVAQKVEKLCTLSSKCEEQNKFEKASLNETISQLETDTRLFCEILNYEAGNADRLKADLSKYKRQHELLEAELKETREELDTVKEEFQARLSFKDETVDSLSSQISKHKLTEANLKKTIEQLEKCKEELLIRLSIEAENTAYFRELSSMSEEQHKIEKRKLSEAVSELEQEKNELSAKLVDATSTIKHLQELSSEYKEANQSLEEEKDILLMNLQKVNESAEFHKKLLDLEYTIV